MDLREIASEWMCIGFCIGHDKLDHNPVLEYLCMFRMSYLYQFQNAYRVFLLMAEERLHLSGGVPASFLIDVLI